MGWAVAILLSACARPAPTAPASTPTRPAGLPADFDLEAEERTVHHGQGGAGAIVDRVELSVRNRSDRPRALRVTGVERLHGSCNAPGWDDAHVMAVREPSRSVDVAAGEALRVAVVFDPIECYNACDRFGFRVHVEIDGAPVTVEAPLEVEREQGNEEGTEKSPEEGEW